MLSAARFSVNGGGARALAAGVLALLFTACGATHNEQERYDYAAAAGLLKPEGCIATCQPTPPPALVDCEAATAGYEFFPIIDITSSIATVYAYDDKTAASTFGELSVGWEPPSERLDRCIGDGDDNPNYVAHTSGGPYLYYGGGTGRAMNTEVIPESPDLPISEEFGKWARDMSQWEGVSFWARRGVESQGGIRVAAGDKYTEEDLAYVDYFSRATNREESEVYPRADKQYCRRLLECDCPLGKPCSYYEGTSTGANAGYYCWDPEVDLPPLSPKPSDPSLIPPGTRFRKPSQGTAQVDYDRCEETRCNRFWPAYEGKTDFAPPPDYCPPNMTCPPGEPIVLPADATEGNGGFDPEFYGRQCTWHTFSDGHSGKYCFNEGEDPPPPESDEWCTDIRYAPVYLTTEWQFFTVPFSEMLQYGYAKETFDLDLKSISTIKFTWDRGWIDFWFDDVALYRRVDR